MQYTFTVLHKEGGDRQAVNQADNCWRQGCQGYPEGGGA